MPEDQDNRPSIARVCHEANRAYCETLGDFGHGSWDEAPGWVRDSVFSGVRFLCQNPQAGPQAAHENWLFEKEEDGWTLGEIKDPSTKRHPYLRPWPELTPPQRMKDKIFHAIVRAMA